MAKIKLNGDTSGYIEISAPAVSGNNTLELGPGTKILTNLDNTFTGVVTSRNIIFSGSTGTPGQFVLRRDSDGANIGQFRSDAGTNDISIGNGGSGSLILKTGANTERLRISSAGLVGIGTVSPASILHTSGSSDQTVTIQTTTAGADSRINFRSSGGIDAGGIHYLHNGNHLTFHAGGSLAERLRITSDGKVGINYAGTPPSEDVMICTSGQASPAGISLSHLSGGNRYGARLQSISGANEGVVISSLFNSTYTERLRIKSDGNVLLGNTTGALSASPVNLSLGGTYSNSAGQNPKLNLWDNGTEYMSLGVSSNQMDFMMSMDDYDFVWYGQNDSNNGPEERMRVDNGNKLLDIASNCKIRLKGSYTNGQTHAHLNIGSDGGGTDTRAIDIWGSWTDQETKSITWNHGTGTSNIVCQQRVRYNTTPSSSVYEIGRLYHNGDTTSFPFKLQSTSTTAADLTVEGNVLHKTAAFVARSTNNNNIQTTTGQKIDYTVDYSYDSVFDNTNDRFTCTKAGLYFFYARHWFNQNTTGTAYLDFMKNGSLIKEFRFTHPTASTEFETVQGSAMIYMAVNDYLEVNARSDGTAIFHESAGAVYSEFSGFYVSGS